MKVKLFRGNCNYCGGQVKDRWFRMTISFIDDEDIQVLFCKNECIRSYLVTYSDLLYNIQKVRTISVEEITEDG